MSIKVFGVFELKDVNLSATEKVQLSFVAVAVATKNEIGIKLGGNIFSGFLKRFENLSGKMPFELTDDPIDVNAECLFIGDGVKVQVENLRVDIGESLQSRMLRVQNFLNEMLQNKQIYKIALDINIEENAKFETLNIRVNNFCNQLLELYKQEENWTPSVRIVVNQS